MISDKNAHLHPVEVLGKNPQWVAFVRDETLRELINNIIVKDVLPPAILQEGDAARIHAFFNSGIEPQVLLLDLSKSPSLLDEAKSLLNFFSPNTRVVVIGKEDHISIFRDLKRLGIVDYLNLPVEEDDIRNAISEALLIPLDQLMQGHALKLKPFVVMLGARGGTGVSTTCVNLAWMTANEFKKRVCLVDFDFYQGSICILLDLLQNTGLNDALNETERLDEIYLKRLILKKDDYLSILTGQINFEQEINFSIDAVRTLIALLRDKYDFVYADLPLILHSPFAQAILSLADEVILITDLSLVSLQGVLRINTFITTYMPHLKMKILANNIFPAGGTVTKPMFEKGINAKIDDVLPYCKVNMLEGVNAGEPFVKMFPNHQYTKILRNFILTSYPVLKPVEKAKPSFLQKLWGSNK